MPPPVDFDSRARASVRLTYILAVVLYAGAVALCCFAYGKVIGFLVSSPILGVYLSWWILHRGGGGLRWLKWWTLRDREGSNYTFQDHPVRVRWQEGQCVVRAQDVFELFNEKVDEQALRRLAIRFGELQFLVDERGDWWFSECAVLQWLDARTNRFDRQAQKLRLWLEREVFPPMRKRLAINR